MITIRPPSPTDYSLTLTYYETRAIADYAQVICSILYRTMDVGWQISRGEYGIKIKVRRYGD